MYLVSIAINRNLVKDIRVYWTFLLEKTCLKKVTRLEKLLPLNKTWKQEFSPLPQNSTKTPKSIKIKEFTKELKEIEKTWTK